MFIEDKSRIHFIILLWVNCHLCRSFSLVCLFLLRSFTTFTTPYILDIKGVISTIKSLFTMIRVLCIIYTTFQWPANVIIVALPAHFICAAASKTIARVSGVRNALGRETNRDDFLSQSLAWNVYYVISLAHLTFYGLCYYYTFVITKFVGSGGTFLTFLFPILLSLILFTET